MVKKPVALDGLLNTQSRPTDTGIPQRGSAPLNTGQKLAPKKREGEKRLTLALDGETYRRLRMHAAETENLPWQRVINSQGACSTGRMTIPLNLQQELLEAEGVVFNEKGCCDLHIFQWHPDGFETEEDIQPSLLE